MVAQCLTLGRLHFHTRWTRLGTTQWRSCFRRGSVRPADAEAGPAACPLRQNVECLALIRHTSKQPARSQTGRVPDARVAIARSRLDRTMSIWFSLDWHVKRLRDGLPHTSRVPNRYARVVPNHRDLAENQKSRKKKRDCERSEMLWASLQCAELTRPHTLEKLSFVVTPLIGCSTRSTA